MLKTYYHVSMDHKKDIKEFIPRIPKKHASGEDKAQKRICVSDTLEGCIQAAPSIWYYIHDYINTEYFFPYWHMKRLTILLEHNEKVGYLFKVYEFVLEESQLISPEVLKKNEWVPDAHKTNEHWITKATKPNQSYFILIQNTREENGEPMFDYTKYEKNELGEIENYYERYEKQKDNK